VGIGANLANLKDFEREKRYKFIKGDILNSELTNKIIRQMDAIVNIAAETHVDRSISNPSLFLYNNTMGTFTLLEAMRKYNDEVTLVHVSTDEVYGEIVEGSFTERSAIKPSNPYSASKAAADMLVLAYYKTYGLKASITRCTNNFGPFQFPEKLIPKTIIRAVKNLSIPIYGSGKNIRDWLFVQDHCEAIAMILNKGQSGEIYNISAGNELSNIQVVKKILSLLNKTQDLITYVEDRPGHDLRYSLDSSKITSELGWKSRYSFEDAIAQTVNWYVANECWWIPLATEKLLQSTPWKK
jgi:dTDP-glucose 4,6-dehydratase